MKTNQLVMPAILLLLCLAARTHAKTWRVNNVPGITADFTTPQLAHDNNSVKEGDTLYIEAPIASSTSYGNLVLTKPLTVISIGDFLSDNPGVQFSSITGYLDNVHVNASAAGSVFHCNMFSATVGLNANNCRFERCRFTSTFNALNILGGNNITIQQNYINGSVVIDVTTNTVFLNNIVHGQIQMNSNAQALISNNILNALNITGNNFIQNATFQNNIINKSGTYTFINCIVKNNLTSNTTLPAGNGNVNSVNMANVFVNESGSNDVSFVLKPAGPAIGAGESGVDCGAYGGNNPFKPGLQAAIPAIYHFVVPSTPVGNTMNITVSTRNNN